MPRVLLFGHLPPPYTGQSISFANLVNALRQEEGKWQVQVVNVGTDDWQPGKINVIAAIRIVRQMMRLLLKLPRAELFYLTIGQSMLGFLRDACLIGVAHLLRKKIVARLDGGAFHLLYVDGSWPLRWLIKLTASQITVFQVLSESIRRKCQVIPGLTHKLQVLANGVEEPANISPRRLPNKGPIRILFLSNLLFEKGYSDLLEAAVPLRSRYPYLLLHLEIAGAFMAQHPYYASPSAARDDFWRRVRECGLEEVTTYHGVVTGERKESLLRQSHLFVLPTYYRYEGQPISVMEAMSYGMPAIVTNWAALPEMVTNGENGFVVPPRDRAALAAAIAKAVATPESYASLSEGALDKFRRDFTLASHSQRMKESFKTALAVKGREDR